jgi:hypothetical protein
MTIAALSSGPEGTYNALFVDTGSTSVADGSTHRHDKLHRIFGETFITAVGDACIIAIALQMARASKKRPNLRDAICVGALFAELEMAYKTRSLLGVPAPSMQNHQPCTTLVVCNRAEVFFWKVEFRAEKGTHAIPASPTFLARDSMVVLRGVTIAPINGFSLSDVGPERIEQVSFEVMTTVNDQLVQEHGAERLPYEFERRLSGVILPHATNAPSTRVEPGVAPLRFLGLVGEPPRRASAAQPAP